MMRIMPAAALALFAVNTFAQSQYFTPEVCTNAGRTVVPVNGVVTSTLANDPNDVVGCAQAATFLEGLSDPVIPVEVGGICLKHQISGTVKASGYSRLTLVFPVFSLSIPGLQAATPFCFYKGVSGDPTRGCTDNQGVVPVPDPPNSGGLQGFTSQAVYTGSVNGKKYQGMLYTKDTGYATPDGFSAQIVLVVGGTDSFENASGRIGASGQQINGFALYNGFLCIP